jgi:hypothetical protein
VEPVFLVQKYGFHASSMEQEILLALGLNFLNTNLELVGRSQILLLGEVPLVSNIAIINALEIPISDQRKTLLFTDDQYRYCFFLSE